VARGQPTYEAEFRLRHKDGHYVQVLSRGFPVRREPDGPVVRIVGTHFDLTERQKREAERVRTELLARLVFAQEDERRRIARELHDEAGQVLTAVKIELDLDDRREASAMVARALAQVRDLSNLLRPSVLDDLGLSPALRAMAEDFTRRTHVEVALAIEGQVQGLPPDHEVVVYRVVQEALTNVARHAGARQVRVALRAGERELRLTVEDDGRGAAGEPTPQLGLLGMRERVTALGGTLTVAASPAQGFRLEALIPMGAVS
jgi:signal transduction histidine kinase